MSVLRIHYFILYDILEFDITLYFDEDWLNLNNNVDNVKYIINTQHGLMRKKSKTLLILYIHNKSWIYQNLVFNLIFY